MRIACALSAVLVFAGVSQAEDKLVNADFEAPTIKADLQSATIGPDGWTVFSSTGGNKITMTSKQALSGKQSVRFEAQESKDSYQGIYQVISVTSGQRYEFRVQARNDVDAPLKSSTRGQISIEWKNADGNEIDRVWGPDWGGSLPADQWKKFEVSGIAPAGAVKAHFVVTQHDGAESGAAGAFMIDSAAVSIGP